MIPQVKILDLVPVMERAANSAGRSAAPGELPTPFKADRPLLLSPAGGGNVRTSQPQRAVGVSPAVGHAGEAEIITAARKVIVRQILELLGNDIPSRRHYRRYLDGLKFMLLCERLDQLLEERLPMQIKLYQSKRERLEIQPELFDKYDRSQKYFGAR